MPSNLSYRRSAHVHTKRRLVLIIFNIIIFILEVYRALLYIYRNKKVPAWWCAGPHLAWATWIWALRRYASHPPLRTFPSVRCQLLKYRYRHYRRDITRWHTYSRSSTRSIYTLKCTYTVYIYVSLNKWFTLFLACFSFFVFRPWDHGPVTEYVGQSVKSTIWYSSQLFSQSTCYVSRQPFLKNEKSFCQKKYLPGATPRKSRGRTAYRYRSGNECKGCDVLRRHWFDLLDSPVGYRLLYCTTVVTESQRSVPTWRSIRNWFF